MVAEHPDVAHGSSNRYQGWEVVDPEKWVPDGYVCVRVDSRGAGRSPGRIDPFSPARPTISTNASNGPASRIGPTAKSGLNGVSYYGINQWHVGSLQPPHLAAMCVWEGAADWYRDMTHHGGILNTFWANWFDMQVKTVQYGLGERGPSSRITGKPICGDEMLSDKQLAANRCDFGDEILAHPLDDDYHRSRSPVWEKMTCRSSPRKLGRTGSASSRQFRRLHARGVSTKVARSAWSRTLDAFLYRLRRNLQKRFFGHYLKASPPGGTASRECNCRCAASIALSSVTRTNGRSPARAGPSSILRPSRNA